MGGAVGHSGEARKTDRVALWDVASVCLNGRLSLRSDLAGDLLPRLFRWLLPSIGCCACEVFAFVKCLSEARSNFFLWGFWFCSIKFQYIWLGFFFFFLKNLWVTGFATICWACHGLDVGLAIRCVFGESVGLRLALLQIICFFSNFSSKIFFGLFFCLKVEQIIFF